MRFEDLQSKQLLAPMEVLAPAQLNDGVCLTIQHQDSIRIENLVRVSHVDGIYRSAQWLGRGGDQRRCSSIRSQKGLMAAMHA